MKNGTYIYRDDRIVFGGTIECIVADTGKKLKIKLKNNTFRYDPIIMDTFFRNKTEATIPKRGNIHGIIYADDYFVLYPMRLGIPFLFEYDERSAE